MFEYQTPPVAPTLDFQHVPPLVTHLAQIFAGTVTVIDQTKSILATAPGAHAHNDGLHRCQLPIVINGQLGTLIIGTTHPDDLPSLTMVYRLIEQLCSTEYRASSYPAQRFDSLAAAYPGMLQRPTFAVEQYPCPQQFRYDQAYYLLLIRLGHSDESTILPALNQQPYDAIRLATQHLEQILGEPQGWMRFSSKPNELVILIESQRLRHHRATQTCSHQEACCCAIQTVASQMFERLSSLLNNDVRIGIAREQADHTSVIKAYEEADTIIQIGSRFQLSAHAWTLEKLGLFAFLGSNDRAIQAHVATIILAPLLAESDLLLTLRTFIDFNGHSNEVASHLHIHRNTLSYRLHKMQELTGYNPYSFNDILVLQSALLIYDSWLTHSA